MLEDIVVAVDCMSSVVFTCFRFRPVLSFDRLHLVEEITKDKVNRYRVIIYVDLIVIFKYFRENRFPAPFVWHIIFSVFVSGLFFI